MKRLFLILCGTLALAACNKTVENSLRTGEDNAEGRIVFRAEQLTKSVTESTASVLQANGFKVAAVTGTTTFFNENVSYVNEKSWFETAQTYYYPSVNTNFFAVYPKTQAISIDGTGAATLTYTSDGNTDLIAAKALDVAARETPQPLTFDHILSQVVIKCQGSDANAEYVVKSVTLSNTDAATYAYSSGEWTGADKDKATAIVSSNTAASTASFTTMGEAVTAVPAEMDLRVTWDCLQGTTIVGSYDETVSFTPTMGKVCTVNCTLPNKDAKAIKFTINVNPWGEETQNVVFRGPVSLNVDKTFVNSLANVSTKPLNNTDLNIDELIDGLINGTSVDIVLNDGDFSVSTDIVDLENPETDGGKIYLTSNSDETKGYSYEIYYEGGEWKIKNTGYLIFEAITDGTIVWKANNASSIKSILYSVDNGETWSEWTSTTEGSSINVTNGDIVYIKGSESNFITDKYSYFTNGTAQYYVYGNISSLADNSTSSNVCFANLFYNNKNIRNHGNKRILLPSTSLANNCYYRMFYGCANLTIAPELPATTLADGCYNSMFQDCTNLSSAPKLPATTLANSCYNQMFYGCSNLTVAPELPATSISPYCYYRMFRGCSNLTVAPELPATTLANSCYFQMFWDCSGILSAPVLPATVLADNCYQSMFYGCTGLTSAPELPAITLTKSCYSSMFEGCSNLTSTPELLATTLNSLCYSRMFYNCSGLISTSELPATTLATGCYNQMFSGCSNLTIAPELPATTLTESCYNQMFSGCSNLTIAPELPATILAKECYYQMFGSCTNLTSAPALPVTNLAESCYERMFYNCTNLTSSPALPATTLARNCYNGMFQNCRYLVSAPILPALSLVDGCYTYMFSGCYALNYVKAMFTTTPSTSYTREWLSFVSTTGTFVKNSAATWDVSGSNGIPSGWTVQTASE